MRKLSMKGKRRKSETSDAESDENGVASGVTRTSDNEIDESSSEKSETTSRKSKSGNKRRSSRSRGKQNDEVDETPEKEDKEKPAGSEQENGTTNSKGGGSKRRKKDEKPEKPSKEQDEDNEDEYEVEKVVAQRTIKGRRQFLVRWKGYAEDADTWEQEKDLNCPQLIEEFLAEAGDEEPVEKTPKTKKSKTSKKTPKKGKSEEEAKDSKDADEKDDDAGDSDKEFEVERIIEVHFNRKNKSREFLIRWKGFSQAEDTWEPEENLNCPDLIEKFMEKVDKAKKTELRELRTNPTLTKHYTLAAHGRRHSRRHGDKQRVTYQGCDE